MKRLLLSIMAIVFAVPVYADCVLQADTADASFALGPFLDSTDGISAETGLTVEDTEVFLKKKGSTTFGAKNDTTDCTHRADGWYTCPLDATDTNTEGNMIVQVTETGAVPVWRECLVVGSGYYDLVDGTTSLMTSRQAGNVLETTITTPTSPTELDLAAGASNDDAYNNMTAVFVGGTEECERQITDYTGTGAILFIRSACPFTLASADTVRIHVGGSGDAQQIAQLDLDVITGSAGVNVDTDAIGSAQIDASFTTEVMASLAFDSGTCDSGTTTTCVDAAAFTTADADYYAKGFAILFTSGTLDKQSACIYDFDPATDTVTFRPALTQAVSTHTYILLAHPTCGGVIAP